MAVSDAWVTHGHSMITITAHVSMPADH